MPAIKWNEEQMSLGIDLIDKEHKNLIDLINKIMVSIDNNNQIKDIEEFIEDALKYAEYHFTSEENLFGQYNLDQNDIKDHKKEHKYFKTMVNILYYDLKNDKSVKSDYGIEMLSKLNNYLSTWLVHHIMEEDKNILNISNEQK